MPDWVNDVAEQSYVPFAKNNVEGIRFESDSSAVWMQPKGTTASLYCPTTSNWMLQLG